MNLIEAIEAGAARVDGRTHGSYINVSYERGTIMACAVGAAYLGCHPDVDPRDVWSGQRRIGTWLYDRVSDTPMGYQTVHAAVTGINDATPGFDWEPVIDRLRSELPAEILEVEVC
jgi:hypothetical protein